MWYDESERWDCDDGGKGGTHIGALINLKKKRKKSVGKQKLEKDTILHGMGRLGSHRAQLLLEAGGPEESRSRLPRILPDLNITHRGGKMHFVTSAACIGLHTLPYL